MKKILITGANGYLASHLAEKLIRNNYEVILVDKKKSNKTILGSKILNIDITKIKNYQSFFKNIKYVFHFAGLADISQSNKDSNQAITDNIIATNILIERCIKLKIERFFLASTLYVYSKDKGGIYKITKKTCEELLLNANLRFGLKYTIMKFGSIYGGSTNNFNLIRNLFICGVKNKNINQPLSGKEIRSYIYIDDVIDICLKLINKRFMNKDVLISGYETISIKNLILKIENIINKKIKIKFNKIKNHDHYEKHVFDIKPKNLIKIKIKNYISLNDGLKREFNFVNSRYTKI